MPHFIQDSVIYLDNQNCNFVFEGAAMKIQREWGGDVSGLEVVWIERAKQKGTKGRCPMDWS
jgi:hypothetical protein